MRALLLPCIVAGAHGVQLVDEAQFEKMFRSNKEQVKEYTFDDSKAEVRQVGPDTAVIAYPIRSTFGEEGKLRTINAVDTSTWVKKDGKWVCSMHAETELSQ